MRVASKQQMYRMLDEGRFGNTTVRWYSLKEWENRIIGGSLWAIRNASTSGGDPRTRLDVPTKEVPGLYRQWYGRSGGEISPMVDHLLVARFQLIESSTGLQLDAVFGHRQVKWREAFRSHVVRFGPTAARVVLRQYLNENSMEDMDQVLCQYSGHAVEMTVMDTCYGIFPHRNAVIWEVRDY